MGARSQMHYPSTSSTSTHYMRPPIGEENIFGLVGVFVRSLLSPKMKGFITASRRMGIDTDGSDETGSIEQPCMPTCRRGGDNTHRYSIHPSIHL